MGTPTPESELRRIIEALYTNDAIILALILSSISRDVPSEHSANVFGDVSSVFVDVAVVGSTVVTWVCVIGLLYLLHALGEIHGTLNMVEYVRTLGIRVFAIPVIFANLSLWIFLIDAMVRVALVNNVPVGIIALSLVPLGGFLVFKLGVAASNTKYQQLLDASKKAERVEHNLH
eukprot:1255064-Pyramimonas_sp.AAC.1